MVILRFYSILKKLYKLYEPPLILFANWSIIKNDYIP